MIIPQNSSVVRGVVIALREERDGMETQVVRFPQIRFRAASGEEVTFEAGMSRTGKAWEPGATVAVRYRRDDPETAEVDRFATLWGATMILAGLSLVFLVVGAGLLLGKVLE